MTSTITAHKFAQTQHAEYEAQAARNAASANVSQESKLGPMLGRITTIFHQARQSREWPSDNQ